MNGFYKKYLTATRDNLLIKVPLYTPPVIGPAPHRKKNLSRDYSFSGIPGNKTKSSGRTLSRSLRCMTDKEENGRERKLKLTSWHSARTNHFGHSLSILLLSLVATISATENKDNLHNITSKFMQLQRISLVHGLFT